MLRSIDRRFLVAASIQFAFSLLHCTFNFYYVKVFVTKYQVTNKWFQISQSLFLVWNAVNDPLFGYLLNNSNWKCSKSRRLPFIYGTPIYILSYLITWFPWNTYKISPDWVAGLHLIVALCFYDTIFTFLGLTCCCLTTEMFKDYSERVQMKWYVSIAKILGAWSIPGANLVSNNLDNFSAFQSYSIFISILALGALLFTGFYAVTLYESNENEIEVIPPSASRCSPGYCGLPSSVKSQSNWSMTLLVLKSKDFHAYIWTEFLMTFQSVFWGNFSTIIVDKFTDYSAAQKSLIFAFMNIGPPIVFIFCRKYFDYYGYSKLHRWSFALKIVLSILMYVIGPRPLIFVTFLVVDCVVCDTLFSLVDVILADVTDKLAHQNAMIHPQSSVIFGLNALFIKPAQSLAPMFIMFTLNLQGDFTKFSSSAVTRADDMPMYNMLFTLCCGIPLVTGLLQSYIWSHYSINSSKNNTSALPDLPSSI